MVARLCGFRGLGVLVDLGFCELTQGTVRCFLFLKGCIEQLHRIGVAQFGSPGLEGTITRNLVMFDGLCGGEQTSVKGRHTLVLVHNFLAFFDNSHNGVAGLALRRFVD